MISPRTGLLSVLFLASCALDLTAAHPWNSLGGHYHHRRLDGHETVIDVGNIRPEGTHSLTPSDVEELGLKDGSYILVTELLNGGVNLLNTDTLEYTNIVPGVGFLARGGAGVYYAFGHIIVCSLGPFIGTPFEIYIYDPATGEAVTTCTPPSDVEPGLFNDLDVVGEVAYVTDSNVNRLWSFNIPGAIEGNCDLNYVELDEDVFLGTGTDNPVRSNGIVAYNGGFIIARFHTGGLYYVEPDNNSTEVMVPLGELTLADGLELVEEEDGTNTLYVTEGSNQISVFKITSPIGAATAPSAELVGVLKTSGYNTPGTSAVIGDTIWTANLGDTSTLPAEGENNTATFNINFTMVGISRFVETTAKPSDDTSGSFGIQNFILCYGFLAGLLFFL